MSRRFTDEEFVGRRFGILVVVERSAIRTKHGCIKWKCECDCGDITFPTTANLMNGNSKSCGCVSKRKRVEARTLHGQSTTPEYNNYNKIRSRCYNPKCSHYLRYGGRGIKMCQRWIDSFENFLADMGKRPYPKATIDRIDSNGDYEPGNCRWATRKEQARNTSNNRVVEWNGVSRCLAEWGEIIGVRPAVIANRLNSGWPIEDVFTLPVKRRTKAKSSI